MPIRPLALMLALAFAGAGAAPSPEPEPSPGKADVRGVVSGLSIYNPAAKVKTPYCGHMLVEGKKERDTAHASASVRILKSAGIFRWVGGKKVSADIKQIKDGCRVQCVFSGDVGKTDPVTASASEVVILSSPKE